MARKATKKAKKTKATKKTKQAASKRVTRKAASSSSASKTKPSRASGKSGEAQTAVEKHWQEYWDCRKRLEETVSLVRAAREALQQAQEAERSRRIEFDKIKGSLTRLLDVEPASSSSRPAQTFQSEAEQLARLSNDT